MDAIYRILSLRNTARAIARGRAGERLAWLALARLTRALFRAVVR
jgi:hypothetical protein